MELDKRIIEGKKPLTCFDIEIAKQFIGQRGYFSHYIDNYADLKNTVLGKLGSTGDTFHESFCTDNDNYYYEFFMPEEWVKEPEKTYRPFTLDEFVNKFSLGDEIILKQKENGKIFHKIFMEFEENVNDIRVGSIWYSFQMLFVNYELYTSEGWKPFGVEE